MNAASVKFLVAVVLNLGMVVCSIAGQLDMRVFLDSCRRGRMTSDSLIGSISARMIYLGAAEACAKGHFNVVDRLLAKQDPQEVLVYACKTGESLRTGVRYLPLIKYLLSQPDRGLSLREPLLAACEASHASIVAYLLKRKDWNKAGLLDECMTRACQAGNLRIVKLLVKYGCASRPDVPKSEESLPIHAYFNRLNRTH